MKFAAVVAIVLLVAVFQADARKKHRSGSVDVTMADGRLRTQAGGNIQSKDGKWNVNGNIAHEMGRGKPSVSGGVSISRRWRRDVDMKPVKKEPVAPAGKRMADGYLTKTFMRPYPYPNNRLCRCAREVDEEYNGEEEQNIAEPTFDAADEVSLAEVIVDKLKEDLLSASDVQPEDFERSKRATKERKNKDRQPRPRPTRRPRPRPASATTTPTPAVEIQN